MTLTIGRTTIPSRPKRFANRFAAYAAAATAAVNTIADDAEAGVVYVDINDTLLFESAPGPGIVGGFDLDDNGTIDFELGQQLFTGSFGAAVGATGPNLTNFPTTTPNQIAATLTAGVFYLQNLAVGTVIDGSLVTFSNLGANKRGYLAYGAAADCPGCEFTSTTTGILGVSFDADGMTNYGWIRVKVDEGDASRLLVTDYAYEDMGNPIQAGNTMVPEPGCLGLLAFGGLGLVAWRRRNQENAQ